jgi:uncharacterized protein DUF4440
MATGLSPLPGSPSVGVAIVLAVFSAYTPRVTAQGPGTASSAEDSVRAVEAARGQALLHADTVALSRMLADEFVEISRLGTRRTRVDNVRDIASGTLHLTSVRYDSLTVRIYGDVAVLQGIAENAGTFRGFPFSGRIRYTRIFVRRDGRWQAIAMQQTSMQ